MRLVGTYRRFSTILALGLLASFTRADQRFFAYTYEPKTLPKGAVEVEQWATMRNSRDAGLYTRWDLRTEYEIGLTDRLTTAIYLNASNVYRQSDASVPATNGMYFRGWSSEWKYKVLDPSADPVGLLLYGEILVDRREWEAEGKVIVGKNIGNVVLAANGVFEQEWKAAFDASGDVATKSEQKVEATAAAAYRFGPYAVGAEARSHAVREGDETASAFFVGPTVHASGERWWATLTLLKQLTDEFSEHEKTETRLLLGFHL
jgi:hypothetical protein